MRIHKIDPENIGLLGDLLSVFDSEQIEIVQRLVRKFGVVGARALANHIIAPYPTPDDPMYVPPITAWLLKEFEDDDRVLAGNEREKCKKGSLALASERRAA